MNDQSLEQSKTTTLTTLVPRRFVQINRAINPETGTDILDAVADDGTAWMYIEGFKWQQISPLPYRDVIDEHPVMVLSSERPWLRPGWCDRNGLCWMGDGGSNQEGYVPSWRLCNPLDGDGLEWSAPHWAIMHVPAA